MRSGNDQFPHGEISIVASSVTRFDTPKINSPSDSAYGVSEIGGRKKKKRGNRTRAFSLVPSISLVAIVKLCERDPWYVTTNIPWKSEWRDARTARCEFSTHDRASPSIKFGDAQGNGESNVGRIGFEWMRSSPEIHLSSRARRGPRRDHSASERRDRAFFLRKRSRDPRYDESYVFFSRALINDFFCRGIDENVETTGCLSDDSSRYFDTSGKLLRIFRSEIKICKSANIIRICNIQYIY